MRRVVKILIEYYRIIDDIYIKYKKYPIYGIGNIILMKVLVAYKAVSPSQ